MPQFRTCPYQRFPVPCTASRGKDIDSLPYGYFDFPTIFHDFSIWEENSSSLFDGARKTQRTFIHAHLLLCFAGVQWMMSCQLRQTCSVCWIFDGQKWGLDKTYAVINSPYGFHSIYQGPAGIHPVPLQGDAGLHPVRSYQYLGSRWRYIGRRAWAVVFAIAFCAYDRCIARGENNVFPWAEKTVSLCAPEYVFPLNVWLRPTIPNKKWQRMQFIATNALVRRSTRLTFSSKISTRVLHHKEQAHRTLRQVPSNTNPCAKEFSVTLLNEASRWRPLRETAWKADGHYPLEIPLITDGVDLF